MGSTLVTGGAGFIGGNFVRHLAERAGSDRITVLDALTYAGNLETIAPLVDSGRVQFVHGDILDDALVSALVEREQVTTIVHFAAESHVDRSIVDPSAFVRTNVLGTQVLLEVARRAWKVNGVWTPHVRFHHVSTDEVYGSLERSDPPFSETTPYSPNSPYAASKASSDHLVRAYQHTYGLPASITNCSNNYGPFQFPEKLIPLIIVNILSGRPLPVYGDGRQVRDWLYVRDHCVAIERVIRDGQVGETYNIGGRAEVENIEIVRRLCDILDERITGSAALQARFPESPAARGASARELITHVTDRPGHDRRYAIDPTKVSTQLGFEPAESLVTGLTHTVDWYLEHEPWWRRVMDGTYRQWVDRQYGAGGLHAASAGHAADA
jgi:dTDP-glucose 4,6-dehydratase